MIPPPPADAITVAQTLTMLDEEFPSFVRGVTEDRYAFWLGSGISKGRVDGLNELVPRVVEFIRERIVNGNPHCRFRRAIEDVFDVAHLTIGEKHLVDLTQPFAHWQNAENIVARLSANYANLLDTLIQDEEDDFLLWNGVDVVSTYADPELEPDVEHLCIAILILEGVASDIASANWDGLVEKAIDRLTGAQPTIVVCVRAQDLREPVLRARLVKFHGCAVKAADDEEVFRPYLVGRQTQINGWVARQENKPLVRHLIGLVATKPTLMMGLSAQDANIQAIFSEAQAQMSWRWPGEQPSYVFSEDRLRIDQQTLLRVVYHQDFDATRRQEILASALIRAYSKPLLISLVLQVLLSKLKKLIEIAPGTLGDSEREILSNGAIYIRDQLAISVEPDPMCFVTNLVNGASRIISLLREGRMPKQPSTYVPISNSPVQLLTIDTALAGSGLPEAAIAIGIWA